MAGKVFGGPAAQACGKPDDAGIMGLGPVRRGISACVRKDLIRVDDVSFMRTNGKDECWGRRFIR
jgi:hypothetical protein